MLLPFIPGSGGGGGGGGGVRGGDNMRIRDHMDGILEARGYFRKHVAAEKDSLYRTVSDVLFGTQKLKDMLRNARDMFVEDREETGIGCSGRKHSELYILSEMLGVTIQLLEATDQNISTVIISPGDGERDEAVIEGELHFFALSPITRTLRYVISEFCRFSCRWRCPQGRAEQDNIFSLCSIII
jgi:hypothetical protein